jgi:hypothetical protein
VCAAATVSAVSSSSLQVQERRVLARSAFLLASLPPGMMQARWAPASAAARDRRLRTRMVLCQGLGFGVKGLGFRVSGPGFRL